MEFGIETLPSYSEEHIDEPAQYLVETCESTVSSLALRRDTFVGTPLYVSPEMLQESISLPASDIWALGCIIFKMHTGRHAYDGNSEHQVFQNILARQLSTKDGRTTLREEIGDVTFDLIDKILQINPKKRLGAGIPGGPNDFEALRAHPYF